MRLPAAKESLRLLLLKPLVRYGIAGGATFAVNMGVIWICIELIGLGQTDVERNVAHFVGAEASILFSFQAHNFWTWRTGVHGYWKRLVVFHLLTVGTILLRQIGFGLLDRAGYHWFVSTLCPLVIAILINFMGYDKFIFRRMTAEKRNA